ncbi:hypothetical protein MES5069_220156 [Mesorhizobium escarrei]|uniref:Uncharacterized protein n=1 Tax=Mesorhizobium escarrei TaxID=666018 RepID=A0ABM9DRX7_9HYPH|nr:hypothetical protein MES5069_220156 [Mesorhizobium escarrei]
MEQRALILFDGAKSKGPLTSYAFVLRGEQPEMPTGVMFSLRSTKRFIRRHGWAHNEPVTSALR